MDSQATRRDTVVVTLPGPVSMGSGPFRPSTADRFLVRHTMANLVRLDCQGMLAPELAREWASEDSGRTWSFTLAFGGGFRAGLPIDAGFIKSAWESRRNGGIWPWRRILDVDAIDSIHLRVRLDSTWSTLPEAFADPILAVAGEFASWAQVFPPVGPVTTLIILSPSSPITSGPVIRFQVLRDQVDPRDALDFPRAASLSPTDLFITRDTAAVSLARKRREFVTTPLAWDRTYALVAARPADSGLVIPDGFRGGLASGVVPGDARVPEPSSKWWIGSPCTAGSFAPSTPASPRIAYQADDPVARALAERLVALSGAPDHGWLRALIPGVASANRPRTIALTTGAMDSALARAEPYAYVLPFPRRPPADCAEIRGWPAGMVLELIESRPYAILRRDVTPVEIDGEGLVRISPQLITGP